MQKSIVTENGENSANLSKNSLKIASKASGFLMYALALDVIYDKISQSVSGKSQGRTFDGSYQENQDQLMEIKRISEGVAVRFASLPQFVVNTLKKEYEDDGQKLDNIKTLEDLWKNKIKEIEEAIARKIFEEEQEKQRKIQENQAKQSENLVGIVNRNIEEEKKENADSLKYRIFASLIFSGILDVTDILGCVLDIFGANTDVAKAIGDVVADEKVLSFFGKIANTFEIDKLVEAVSHFPVIYDINQSFLDLKETEAFQTFSPLAKEALTGDLTDYAIRVASFANFATGERGLQISHEKRSKENDEKIRELETLIKEGMPDPNEIAKNAIITETEFRLDEIYIRNFLKSVCQNGEEITDSDKRKLNQYFIRTEDKQQCGTLLDKLETIKSEANEEKKLEMLKETISLVVDDKERNNKDVLKSLREIARERFYGLDSENLNFKEMNKERNEYLDSIFPEDFKLNEDKIKELKEIFKQKGKIVEENLDLSSKENITKFVKKEFGESPNDFDDVVKKIAVFVKKNEIASSIIESPYFRISPKPVVSGGDSVGGGIEARPLCSSAKVPPL